MFQTTLDILTLIFLMGAVFPLCAKFIDMWVEVPRVRTIQYKFARIAREYFNVDLTEEELSIIGKSHGPYDTGSVERFVDKLTGLVREKGFCILSEIGRTTDELELFREILEYAREKNPDIGLQWSVHLKIVWGSHWNDGTSQNYALFEAKKKNVPYQVYTPEEFKKSKKMTLSRHEIDIVVLTQKNGKKTILTSIHRPTEGDPNDTTPWKNSTKHINAIIAWYVKQFSNSVDGLPENWWIGGDLNTRFSSVLFQRLCQKYYTAVIYYAPYLTGGPTSTVSVSIDQLGHLTLVAPEQSPGVTTSSDTLTLVARGDLIISNILAKTAPTPLNSIPMKGISDHGSVKCIKGVSGSVMSLAGVCQDAVPIDGLSAGGNIQAFLDTLDGLIDGDDIHLSTGATKIKAVFIALLEEQMEQRRTNLTIHPCISEMHAKKLVVAHETLIAVKNELASFVRPSLPFGFTEKTCSLVAKYGKLFQRTKKLKGTLVNKCIPEKNKEINRTQISANDIESNGLVSQINGVFTKSEEQKKVSNQTPPTDEEQHGAIAYFAGTKQHAKDVEVIRNKVNKAMQPVHQWLF